MLPDPVRALVSVSLSPVSSFLLGLRWFEIPPEAFSVPLLKPNRKNIAMSTKLYVGNLSFKATQDEVRDIFSQFGNVVDVALPMDRESGRPRGFAFVTMETGEEAQKAVDGLNGQNFQGRDLQVNEARPPEPRTGGGRGYGGERRGGGGGDRRGGGGGYGGDRRGGGGGGYGGDRRGGGGGDRRGGGGGGYR